VNSMLKPSTSPDRISALIKGYMPVLDGYRGIAIFLVFLHHCVPKGEVTSSGFLNSFYKGLMDSTWCGVDIFFVLSGFLITGIILDTCERPNFFRNFYIKRVIRIFPPYYVTLLIFCVLYLFLKNEFFNRLCSSQIWYWLYLENWLWLFQGFYDNPLLHFWSLAVEAQFYLVWPALIYFCPRKLLSWLLVIVILCTVGIRGWLLLTNPFTPSLVRILYFSTLCRIDGLVMGALLAVWMRSDCMLSRLLRRLGLVMIASGTCLGLIITIQKGFSPFTPVVLFIGFFLFSIFFGMLLVLSLAQPENSVLSRILTWFPLKKLGTVSYGFYVYHFPICWMFRDRIYQYIGKSFILNHLGTVLFCGTLSLVISLFSWYCLEQPILRLKTYFSSNRDNRSDSVTGDTSLQKN